MRPRAQPQRSLADLDALRAQLLAPAARASLRRRPFLALAAVAVGALAPLLGDLDRSWSPLGAVASQLVGMLDSIRARLWYGNPRAHSLPAC